MRRNDIHHLDWVEKALSEPFAKSDVLFRSVSASRSHPNEWRTNASVREADDYAYTEGYRLAGRILANHVINERWDTDFLVYPVAFLYRHYIELQFKRMIPDAAFLCDHRIGDETRRMLVQSHRLDQLWGLLKPLLQQMSGLGVSSNEIEAIDSYVRQMHEIDELSFSFRYPTTKAGTPSINTRKLPQTNIAVFAACMERVTSYLYGLGCGFRAMKIIIPS